MKKAKVNVKKHGYEKIFVSFNGASLELSHGQTITNTNLIDMYPKYFDVLTENIVEIPEPVILTEDSSNVETAVEAPVKTTKKSKKSAPVEAPVEEAPVEEAPVEAPVEEAPVEAPVEEAPAE